jgi:hypothetical protein
VTATRYLAWPSIGAIAVLVGTWGGAGCSDRSEPDLYAPEGSSGGAGSSADNSAQGGEVEGEAGSSSAAGGKSQDGGNGGTSATVDPGQAGGGPEDSGAPPAVDGKAVYTLECRGDSKDCNNASVPCFGVGGSPEAALGYACSNRCSSIDDCSHAPTGTDAQVGCVPFTSASHCVLVCKQEALEFACPTGMSCYVYPGSPVGYCLWQ